MSPVLVDADILLASEDGCDPDRQARANAWLQLLWERRLGRVSTQVLDEFYLNATRRLTPPMPAGDARAEVRRYELWRPWRIDHATVESAWALESRYGLHYLDCLVVAAAQHLGCRYLLSAQLPHEGRFGAVQILDPLRTGTEVLDQP